MRKSKQQIDFIITGIGVVSNIGQGKEVFTSNLISGNSTFNQLKRSGRQLENKFFIGAEISELTYPKDFPQGSLRSASFSSHVALIALKEAWEEAELDNIDSERIGLIIGGSNFQQRHLQQLYQKYNTKPQFITPTYGFSFFDSDLSALCTEYFGIKGLAYTIGGASASGQLAIIEAIKAIQAGQVDVCIVVGALMDLSFWELQGFKALGAMGSDRYKDDPGKACRPFDLNRDGFIFGENCGAIVLEKQGLRKSTRPYAKLVGWSLVMDANRNPNSSYEGELKVIQQTLNNTGISASDIDYINPHGTGSPLGDEIELKALKRAKLNNAYINSTKSIIGHGLTAAGTVEVIATLLQMKASKLHPSLNLEEPIDNSFNWVKGNPINHEIKKALTLSVGFGGINTALCLEKK
jgi:malonyl-ACP decarboxylase